MAIIAMNGAEVEESNSGQNGAGNSYAGIASIIAYSEAVGVTFWSWNPPLASNARYSSMVRSFPPVSTSITKSISFPVEGRLASDKPHSTSSRAPLAGPLVCTGPEFRGPSRRPSHELRSSSSTRGNRRVSRANRKISWQMFSPGFRALYIVSAVLFLKPWSLLFSAWLAFDRAKVAAPLSIWRRYLVYVALLAASVSTVSNMAWNASWLKHGGSPHGMGAGPGLWQSLGPF
jgi:hypothetical protein